jgi:type I restriction enzyme R subunit
MKFNEDSRVKIPTILHLMRLGYSYLSLKNQGSVRDESTNIFTDIFYESIKRINPTFTDLKAKQCFDEVSLCLEKRTKI